MKKLVVGCWLLATGVVMAMGARAAELPAGYSAVEYLVAPRGAYIDTGYKPNQNTRVVMDVTVKGKYEYWFGCWDRNYNDGAFAFGNDGGGIYAGYGNQGGTFGSVVANGRHSVELDKGVVKVDGGQVHAFNAATFALANNLYLFAQNRNGEIGIAGAQTTIVCHGCAIYDNGTQVRDFVPCTSPGGRTGLYDQIGQRFYALAVKLPSGYTAVEYIESTKGGGQFIDTGYTANGQTKVVFDAVIPARWEQNDRFGVLFGSRTMTDWWVKAFALQMCDGNTAVDTVRFAYNGAYRQDGGKPFSFGERVTVTCDGQHVEWTGSKAASVDFIAESLASSKSTLYIFADNSVAADGAKSKTGLNHSVMRLYSFRITEGGTLKRDFVPCVRLADAVAGLYDTVEGVFYENAGTGAFTMSASSLPFGRELASGTYEITESFAFAAPKMESALKIAEGATVTLNIAEGVEVTLRGGDAHEVWGGGAGIEVPANATLKVTGDGKLNVYGGKGANGCDGMAGGNGSADGNNGNFTSGAGGAGGWGGGGAGAGIGGHGASGGGGGNGGQSVTAYGWSYTDINGNSGDNGGNGKKGGTCGTVSIEGTVKVFAQGGAAGAADANLGVGGTGAWTKGSTYHFGAFGGGGGGSGEKGGAAADIGGGGAGGYGGGGGGSGGYFSRSTTDRLISCNANGGGGAGAKDGWRGEININGVINNGFSYPGGSKGTAGSRGGSGTLTVAEFAVVISASGESDSYGVGRISATEYIRWESGRLYRVVEGVRTELPYSVVDANTSSLGDGWYVVKDIVERGGISVNGTANLVLLRNSSLTASGVKREAGVSVSEGNALKIFGVESGSLTATGGEYGAGIGGGNGGAGGTVTINGGTVTATGGTSGAGIGGGREGAGGEVTINGGTVTATGGDSSGAGIGGGFSRAGGTVTINGGTVTAMGGTFGAGIGGGNGGAGGAVTVNGGEVTATGGGSGAGIGGGSRGKGGNVTINGGTVTATGGTSGAGIGGGREGVGGTVTINSGIVTVTGGEHGAGIGGGERGAGGTVTINGGTVTATSGGGGAGIGGGNAGAGGTVTINGGTVTATGGIGGGYGGSGGSLTLGPRVLKIDDRHYQEGVTADFEIPAGLQLVSVREENGGPAKNTGNGVKCTAAVLSGQRLVLTFAAADFEHRLTGDAEVAFGPLAADIVIDASQLPGAVVAESQSADYVQPDGKTATAKDACPLYATGATMPMGQGGWYVVTGEVTTAAIEVNGVANLILADGATLTVNGGIGVDKGATLNIYGQEAETGELIANGADNCAGIGGRNPDGLDGRGTCGTVAIYGGTVTATGGKNAAGIGGGWKGADGTVTLGMSMYVTEGAVGNGSSHVKIVVLPSVTVTVGDYANMTAEWTHGDGAVTNAIGGTSFKIPIGMTNAKVIFTPVHNYRFKDAQETGVRALASPIEADCTVTPPAVEGIPGTVVNPWRVGEAVTAYVSDEGTLVVGGTGAMSDFASAAEVPWNGVASEITAVTIDAGVTQVGKNALAALADPVRVNGTQISVYRTVSTVETAINGMPLADFNAAVRYLNVGEEWKTGPASAEPVIPEGMVLVSKTEIKAAAAETVTVVGGAVTLGVTVNTNGDLTAETKSWQPVELKGENVKVENGKIVITIPVDSQSGFMVLQSGDASVPTE